MLVFIIIIQISSMATLTSSTAGAAGADWDEAQCISALAQLEQLQTQVGTLGTPNQLRSDNQQLEDLRLAMPRIIEPFQRPPNPGMFKLYAQGVLSTQNNIKTLNERWRGSEIQGVFEHTKKSLAANADLSASTSISHRGWTERAKKELESTKSSGRKEINETDLSLTSEEITNIFQEFQKAHPTAKLETQDEVQIISVHM